MRNRNSVKKLVLIAMLAAVAYVIVCLIRVPVVLFLNYEPKDVIITIGGFLLGPACAFVVSLLVSLLEMVTISGTGPIGALMNLLSTCSFACTAAIIYKKRHTFSGAIIGLTVGAVTMTAMMVLWNWLITPLYMGVSQEVVQGMLIPYFLPFNLFKATLNCALVLMFYKPLVIALRRVSLVEAPSSGSGKVKIGVYLLSAGLLVLCILMLLVLQGKT